MTKRVVGILAIAILLCGLTLPAMAQPERSSVGLGVSLGAAFPQGQTDDIKVGDWKGSFNWGFYVNIPLIYTFHLTPSAELYRLGEQNATDIALAFKFIIPVWKLDLFFGFVPGLTTSGEKTLPHVGAMLGVSFRLFSNLDFFVQAKYKFLFDSSQNFRMLHGNAGILYHF